MARPSTLVWIDTRDAIIVSWRGDRALVEREESEVPAHHRSTGHIRHDPGIRHGGGGVPQTAGEPHRIEHLERFVERVAGRLPPDGDVVILGPGTVRERLERRIRLDEEGRVRSRLISCEASPRLTDRQLIARVRHIAGADPLRRTSAAPARRGRAASPAGHRPARRRLS